MELANKFLICDDHAIVSTSQISHVIKDYNELKIRFTMICGKEVRWLFNSETEITQTYKKIQNLLNKYVVIK